MSAHGESGLDIVKPRPETSSSAYIKGYEEYKRVYRRSVEDPDGFWDEMAANELDWFEGWSRVMSWDEKEYRASWFEGARLNAVHNCLDRHVLGGKADKTALIWEPGEPGEGRSYSYGELLDSVCMFANVLKKYGVSKGDTVCMYLPMIPELVIAMLACARIGAVHTVVFGGFSPHALRDRIMDSKCETLVTADGVVRSGKMIELKKNADIALEETEAVRNTFVVEHIGETVGFEGGRDHWWHQEMEEEDIGAECKAEQMESEDPLFILYTSGSTGKPKGVIHTTAGYLLQAALTHKWIFDVHDDDIWWCTADIGWVTGHSYIVYGPLANGSTSLMFEGTPTYPHPDRYWQVCEKYAVTGFYTAPTVLRALMRYGDGWIEEHDLSTLRVLGSVGEPINPEVWTWYYQKIGGGRCPVVDTWWQTETGAIMVSPIVGGTPMKPGSASMPFPGVVPAVLDQDGEEVGSDESGYLVIKRPWPSMLRTLYGDHERYVDTYFSKFPGLYLTGDGCRVDEDGFYWMEGRIDDVMNVSGHRIGTAEIESAIVDHDAVTESAVVGFAHEIKGQSIYAFVTLKKGFEVEDESRVGEEIRQIVSERVGTFAKPDVVQVAAALPKTRSGKIMRRILRKIAEGKGDELGDTSTLADPSVVGKLLTGADEARLCLEEEEEFCFVESSYYG